MERGKRTLREDSLWGYFQIREDVRCEEKSGSGTMEKARKVIRDTVLETANAFEAKATAANPMASKSNTRVIK